MDFSFAELDTALGAKGAAAARRNLPLKVTRYDAARESVTGLRLDNGDPMRVENEVTVTLLPDKAAASRKFRRPTMKDLARKVQIGGVIRFDRAVETAPGRWDSEWGSIVTNGEFDDQAAAIGWAHVRPFIPPQRRDDPLRLGLDLVHAEAAYALPADGSDAAAAIAAALRRCLEEIRPGGGYGTAAAWFMLRFRGEHRCLRVVRRYREDGPVPVEGHLDAYLPRIWLQTLTAGLAAGAELVIAPAAVFYMGHDQIKQRALKGQLPDRWYRPAGASDEPSGDQEAAHETAYFARSCLSLRRRESGSWFFTDAIPVEMKPRLCPIAELLAAAGPGAAP